MGLFSTECSNCGSIEHTTDDCPHGLFSSNKCRHCGSIEHASDDCPHGIFSSNKCRHCGSLEHASDDCPHGIFSSNKCRHCGSVEHASDDCPHGIFSSNKCRYCGSVNHASDDCPHGVYRESSPKQRTASAPSSDDDNSGTRAIGWLIGVGIVVFVVVWLAVNVVLPVALLNSALVLTILAVVKKERKILFPILALVGGCYMFFDIMNGWLSANFVNNVVNDKIWITAFAYINSAAMGISTWLLVKPIWVNAKLSLAKDKSKSILLMSSVVLLISIATLLTPILFNTVNSKSGII